MLWKGRRQSGNVVDRRGAGPAMAMGGGVGGIILLLIILFLGGDPSALLNQGGGGMIGGGGASAPLSAEQQQLGEFVAVVLADTEDVWNRVFREQLGKAYQEPKLVLFSGAVQSACGQASAAVGPFYCPADQQVYIDLSFYEQLERRFNAPGDFAQAYVIAHEVGHHVQNLLGYSDRLHQARGRVSESEYNQLSVRLELQADFLAGVWAHHAQKYAGVLEEGDIDEALRAASAIGDDAIQKQSQGYVVPDSFTHGTSEQRMRWFMKGFRSGRLDQGDTFQIPESAL
jgi:predicted metalloprotease